jgi:hypothetical protein
MMEQLTSLIQTCLWVGLIGTIVWRYHKPIDAILQSVNRRIEAGHGLKAGPFELTAADLKTQDPDRQREKLDKEADEIIQAETPPVSAQPATVPIPAREDVRTQYVRAEDLALRAVQAEYGVPVSRQVQINAGLEFDGFFVKDGRAYIVEVKYVRGQRYLNVSFEEQIDRIIARVTRVGWRNFVLLLVVVFADSNVDPVAEANRLSEVAKSLGPNVEVRCYSLAALATKFGLNFEK